MWCLPSPFLWVKKKMAGLLGLLVGLPTLYNYTCVYVYIYIYSIYIYMLYICYLYLYYIYICFIYIYILYILYIYIHIFLPVKSPQPKKFTELGTPAPFSTMISGGTSGCGW